MFPELMSLGNPKLPRFVELTPEWGAENGRTCLSRPP